MNLNIIGGWMFVILLAPAILFVAWHLGWRCAYRIITAWKKRDWTTIAISAWLTLIIISVLFIIIG